MRSDKSHWERCYRANEPEAMSWYEAEPARSLALLQRAGLDLRSAVIDVGGGASTLVDELLASAVHSVTVLDIAGAALETSRARLGTSAGDVTWPTMGPRVAAVWTLCGTPLTRSPRSSGPGSQCTKASATRIGRRMEGTQSFLYTRWVRT